LANSTKRGHSGALTFDSKGEHYFKRIAVVPSPFSRICSSSAVRRAHLRGGSIMRVVVAPEKHIKFDPKTFLSTINGGRKIAALGRGSLGNPLGTSLQLLTQDTLDVFLEGSLHVLLGVFKTAATNDDQQPLTNSAPAIIFGPETAIERYTSDHRQTYSLGFHKDTSRRSGLNLLERRLMESHTTIMIPFDDRVIIVGLLNCAEFSSRLSEVTQTLDAISGIQFLVGGRGLDERWLLGTV